MIGQILTSVRGIFWKTTWTQFHGNIFINELTDEERSMDQTLAYDGKLLKVSIFKGTKTNSTVISVNIQKISEKGEVVSADEFHKIVSVSISDIYLIDASICCELTTGLYIPCIATVIKNNDKSTAYIININVRKKNIETLRKIDNFPFDQISSKKGDNEQHREKLPILIDGPSLLWLSGGNIFLTASSKLKECIQTIIKVNKFKLPSVIKEVILVKYLRYLNVYLFIASVKNNNEHLMFTCDQQADITIIAPLSDVFPIDFRNICSIEFVSSLLTCENKKGRNDYSNNIFKQSEVLAFTDEKYLLKFVDGVFKFSIAVGNFFLTNKPKLEYVHHSHNEEMVLLWSHGEAVIVDTVRNKVSNF